MRRTALSATLWLLCSTGVSTSCLPDAVRPDQQEDIVIEGVAMPLGVWVLNWDSAILASQVFSIVSSEALGYNTTIVAVSDTDAPGMFALGGCGHPFDISDPQCNQHNEQRAHVLLEHWSSVPIQLPWFAANAPESAPEDIGGMGYEGDEGAFLSTEIRDAALSASGSRLDIYAFYNSSWFDVHEYFDSFGVIPQTLLMPCAASNLGQPGAMEQVVRVFPDPEGFDTSSGLPVAKCVDGYWWRSPACRASPSKCIPFVTGGKGWWLRPVMQKAIALNMPLAVAVAASWGDYVQIVSSYKVLFYNWGPSAPFVPYSMAHLMFPENNDEEEAAGIFVGMEDNSAIRKMAYNRLSVVAPRAHHVAKQLTIYKSQMNAMLVDLARTGDGHADVACRWLQANRAVWQAWLPVTDPTVCTYGNGVRGAGGVFLRNRTGALGCAPCPAGMFSEALSDSSGATRRCTACPMGQVQAHSSSDYCVPCESGYYRDEIGESLCERCPKGTFSAGTGRSACDVCPPGKTTDGTGFRSASDCQCPPGAFLPNGSDTCVACGEGADCAGFGAPPLALPGYQLAAVNPSGLSIFRCHAEASRCVGGDVGVCAEGREGIACALCQPGFTRGNAGACVPCRAADRAPFAISITLACSVLAILYFRMAGHSHVSQDRLFLAFGTSLGQVVLVLQVSGVFGHLSVPWAPSLQGVMSALRVFSMDIQVLRLDCVGAESPLQRNLLVLAAGPCAILYVVFLHVATRLGSAVWRGRAAGAPVASLLAGDWSPVVRVVGTITMILFVTIVTVIVSPLQCQENPNAMWTMVQDEAALCWQGGAQSVMVGVGAVVFLLPLGFIAAVVRILYVFPQKMRSGDAHFLNSFAFLFFRVKPRGRWFALVFLLRNLAIAFVPAIPVTFIQLVFLQVLFEGSLILLLTYSPWRLPNTNEIDVATNVLLHGFVCVAAFFVQDGATSTTLAAAAAALLLGTISVIAFIALLTLGRYLRTARRRQYQFFLCHHKAGASALSRLLKMSLLERGVSPRAVFIDSDNLSDLDELFGIVCRQVWLLVVLCSKEVLHRTWCLGEVVSAHLSGVETLPVHFPDFQPPDDHFIENIGTVVDVDLLSSNGLGLVQVQKTLAWFRGLTPTSLPLVFDRRVLAQLTLSLLGRNTAAAQSWMRQDSTLQPAIAAPRVAILSDRQNRDASASAIVLQKLLAPTLAHNAEYFPVLFEEMVTPGQPLLAQCTSVTTVLVLCTNGCFADQCFLLGLVYSLRVAVHTVLPVVTREEYSFPDAIFYAHVEAGVERLCELSRVPVVQGLLTKFVEHMFKKIALMFNTTANKEALESQAAVIGQRLGAGSARAAVEVSPAHREAAEGILAVLALSAVGGDATVAGVRACLN